MPKNVQDAISKAKGDQKHSEFHSKLKDLNTKIKVYKQIFDTRIPNYQKTYVKRREKWRVE